MSPAEVEGWAKAVGAIVAAAYLIFGPLGRRWLKWRRRRAESERTIRYLADAVHALLRERVHRPMPDGDRWLPSDDDLAQQAIRVYEQRNTLFRADGHEPPRREPPRPMTPEEVLVLIRRTQAVKEMKDREATPAPLFKDNWEADRR